MRVYIPEGPAEFELIVRRSRFLARAGYIGSLAAAKEEVRRLKNTQPDATHVVHACIIGPGGDEFSVSDDREPKGTAGRPVLEILRGSGITFILVTVTRWFGGTKLGTGGLVRAYGDTAKGVLDVLPLRKLECRCAFSVCLPYTCYEQAVKILEMEGGIIDRKEFGTDVLLEGTIAEGRKESWESAVRDMTGGSTDVEWID